jgi:hypothetical protein
VPLVRPLSCQAACAADVASSGGVDWATHHRSDTEIDGGWPRQRLEKMDEALRARSPARRDARSLGRAAEQNCGSQ